MEVINPPGTQTCPRCGHQNDEKAFFCSQCGTPVCSRSRYEGRTGPPSGYDRPYSDNMPLISLLVSIFGFFVAGFIGPLIGVILGHVSIRRMNRSGDHYGRGMAVASLIIGYALLALGLFILIALGVFVGWAIFNGIPSGWQWGNC